MVMSTFFPIESFIFGQCGLIEGEKESILKVLMFSVRMICLRGVVYLDAHVHSYNTTLNPKFNNIYKQHRNEGRIGHTGQLEFTAT